MTPVLLLSDGYLANGAEPWRIPDPESLEKIAVHHPTDPKTFHAFSRDEHLARPWAIPGTPDFEHRIGGLEKSDLTGNVSYDPDNHQRMTELRHEKVGKVAEMIGAAQPYGDAEGDLLVVGWGGTYGSILTAVKQARADGLNVSALHLRYLNPMARNVGEVLKRFKKVLVAELNTGQLRTILRAKYLVDARGFNKVQGKPFLIEELRQAIDMMLEGRWPDRESLSPHHHELSLDEQTPSPRK